MHACHAEAVVPWGGARLSLVMPLWDAWRRDMEGECCVASTWNLGLDARWGGLLAVCPGVCCWGGEAFTLLLAQVDTVGCG